MRRPFFVPMNGFIRASSPPLVDLNAAGAAELSQELPGIGPKLAERIVSFREDKGGFTDPRELASIPGIGPRLVERIADRVSVLPTAPHVPTLRPAPQSTALFGEDPVVETKASLSLPPPEAKAEGEGSSPAEKDDAVPMTFAAQEEVARHDAPVARLRRQRALTGLMVGFGMALGGLFAWRSDRSLGNKAALVHVDEEVRSLRETEDRVQAETTRHATEIARQAKELAATKETLARAMEAEHAEQAKAEARSTHLAQDVAELRRQQAKADSKVYKLDEAIKLIDWAATRGLAGQAVSDTPAVHR
jgi:competence ComEA-like helix-hairpin-helix protein